MGDPINAAFEVSQRMGKDLCDRHRAEGTLTYLVSVPGAIPPGHNEEHSFETPEQAQAFVQEGAFEWAVIMENPPAPWYPGWTILVYRDGAWVDKRS